MSGGRRATLSPSLFPFLAVLICTLGTLILLLALVAQNASEHAVAEATQKAKATSNVADDEAAAQHAGLRAQVVDSMIEEEQFRVEKLVSFRKQQTADIEERRDRIAHVEAHMQKLREQLARLSSEVERALSSDDVKLSENRLESLQRELTDESELLEKLKAESGTQKPRVVIVPHKGPNGTDRRPIYLECTEQGMVVWPEQIQISVDQLERSQPGANPVEAALRVVRNHAMQVYGDAAPPYPLLVVRPDGIETYAAARGAMKDYDDQFGYELVPADVQLAMPNPDPNLRQSMQQAVTQSIEKQVQLASIARSNNVRQSSRLPVLSAASLDRQGRTGGYREVTRDDARYGFAGGNDATNAARAYATQQNRYSSPSSTTSNAMGSGYSAEVSGASSGIDPAQEQKWANDMRDAAAELRGRGSSLDESLGGLGDQPMTGALGGHSDADASTEERQTMSKDDFNNAGYTMPDSSLRGPSLAASDFKSQDGTFHELPDGQLEDQEGSSSASHAGGSEAQGSAKSMPNQPVNSQGSGSGSPQMKGQMAGQQNAKADRQPPPQSSYSQTPASQLAQPGQKEWALPRNVAGMNGSSIVRTMKAQSHEDRFVLLGTNRGEPTEVFGVFNNDPRRAILEMATAVRDRVDRWGVALPGGRWQPQLEVEVLPGGETRFTQLQRLMQDSGVDVVAKLSDANLKP
ncbi:hypothetical protein N9N28_06125 [Rubripirellula amarantea]|nr:hypothetical protein [Rubripirellula amarantea]